MRALSRGLVAALAVTALASCIFKKDDDSGGASGGGDPDPSSDPFFANLTVGIGATWTAPVKVGPPPTATAAADDPKIGETPAALMVGPDALLVQLPVRFTDITRLDENEAPSRAIFAIVGDDSFYWEIPIDPKEFIADEPVGYIWTVGVRNLGAWDALYALGARKLKVAIGEKGGAVGAYKEIPLSVSADALGVDWYATTSCDELATKLGTVATKQGDAATYSCRDSGLALCRATAAIDAKCASTDTVVEAGTGDRAAAKHGMTCRSYKNMSTWLGEAMTSGVPYDGKAEWPGTGTASSAPCYGLASVDPSAVVGDTLWKEGYLCCP